MKTTSKLTAFTLASLGLALVATTALAERRGDMAGRGAPFAMMDFATVDADKDGKVTPAEIEAARTARLKAADTNGDGFFDAAELEAMGMARMKTRAADMAAKRIERQDRDGDGKLSMAEMAPQSPQERMFARMDTDKDGALSEAEITAAKDRMQQHRGDRKGHHRQGGDQPEDN